MPIIFFFYYYPTSLYKCEIVTVEQYNLNYRDRRNYPANCVGNKKLLFTIFLDN